jgi:hypothetical protein
VSYVPQAAASSSSSGQQGSAAGAWRQRLVSFSVLEPA